MVYVDILTKRLFFCNLIFRYEIILLEYKNGSIKKCRVLNEYRLKIREKGKRKFKSKVRQLTKQIKAGTMTSKEAYKYLSGHLGYIKIANTRNLEKRLFYNENIN